MTDFKCVFVDTAPFIYCLEKNKKYFELAKHFFEHCYLNDIKLITSVITIEEYCVYHYKHNQFDYIKNFEKFIINLSVKIVSIDKEIAVQAAKLRALYDNIRGMDSLQLASCLNYKCDAFVTNDLQLKQVKEIKTLFPENWI